MIYRHNNNIIKAKETVKKLTYFLLLSRFKTFLPIDIQEFRLNASI